MNKCYLQLWEQSFLDGNIPDGCSVHVDLQYHSCYVDQLYGSRNLVSIPQNYDRVVGLPFECFISDDLYELLLCEKNIRLSEVEKSNLIRFQDLITKL